MKVENIQGGEVMPLKKKLLRLAPFVGALLLLTSVIWPLPVDQGTISAIACILFLVGFLGFLDRSFELRHPKNLAIITAWIIVIGFVAADYVWREGKIVAEAWFNPGSHRLTLRFARSPYLLPSRITSLSRLSAVSIQ